MFKKQLKDNSTTPGDMQTEVILIEDKKQNSFVQIQAFCSLNIIALQMTVHCFLIKLTSNYLL